MFPSDYLGFGHNYPLGGLRVPLGWTHFVRSRSGDFITLTIHFVTHLSFLIIPYRDIYKIWIFKKSPEDPIWFMKGSILINTYWIMKEGNMTRDEEIIEKLATSLSKFGKVRDGVYQFRCIYCGDSRKNPYKRRGYMYLKGNSYITVVITVTIGSLWRGYLRILKLELFIEWSSSNLLWVDWNLFLLHERFQSEDV